LENGILRGDLISRVGLAGTMGTHVVR
jgi:hypothetical protein